MGQKWILSRHIEREIYRFAYFPGEGLQHDHRKETDSSGQICWLKFAGSAEDDAQAVGHC
jgi:hypothetical protein